MNRLRLIFCACFLIIWLIAPGCKKTARKVEPSLFQNIVTAHTSGVISRESSIRVRFVEEIAESAQFNVALERSPFSFEPRISGIALWTDARTLEFRPDNRLPGDVRYTAKVKLSDFTATDSDKEIFQFEFSTVRQYFEIYVKGLEGVIGSGPEEQLIHGEIVTADVEIDSDIEELVTATQQGKDLTVSWNHNRNRRNHSFTVEGVVRGNNPSTVTIRWNGSCIGVDRRSEQVVLVPALSTFSVLQARAVQGEEEYVEIRFSDPVDSRQDLRGLIQIDGRNDLRFSREQNIIRAYSSSSWTGTCTVTVNPGIRNVLGHYLPEGKVLNVVFREILPEVRFSGKGVILPTSQGLTIPIETNNLSAVVVKAIRVYEKNIPQFLQVNSLEEDGELNRVGRVVWEKTIPLGYTPDKKNRWIRYGLDVSPLIEEDPAGLYQIHVSFRRPHIVYRCSDSQASENSGESDLSSESWDQEQENSYWDNWEEGFEYRDYYRNRNNPCHPAYYREYYDHNINLYRNVLVSDLGLIAKRGNDDSLFVAVTDIKSTEPLSGVDVTLLDYQHQVLANDRTSGDGTVLLSPERKPYLLVARSEHQAGYLRLDDGSSLSVSQFDVSGATITKGLKGFIYGERGVWRPGDPIHLTFILLNTDMPLPGNYPVRLELRNPRGQLIKTVNRKGSLNGFYTFKLETDPDAPTGNWSVRIKAGGAEFSKILKVETVMPNRLKIDLDFGPDVQSLKHGTISGNLSASWLHGAVARNLKADIELTLNAGRTRFSGYDEYSFDDPAMTFKPESRKILDGALDETGNTRFSSSVQVDNVSPGILTATFNTRVFEQGGAFSIDRISLPYHPFDRYIGIRTPPGDKARGMLLTDTRHPVRIVALDTEGTPVADSRVKVEVYKIRWRWWWEKSMESLADYIGTRQYRPIQSATVDLTDGTGLWEFEVKYPDWGRYLIRVSDQKGKHVTGKIVYIDWPGWAGRAQKDMPGGAAVLSFSSDKEEYTVGEKVILTIPTGSKGRGLVSLESGSRVLQSAWIETGEEAARYEFTATDVMAPNIYAHVTLLQPHMQAGNDLPIRMYGVIPIKVLDPGTRLDPVIEAPEVFKPEQEAQIKISEKNGKPMTYTVAVVDEGLLDLTRFATPDPWAHFYRREALGVKTWDLFDLVAGAFGGDLERLLAIGGGEEAGPTGQKKADRFPPLVRFLGPFELGGGKTNTHQIPVPQYVGSVRIMAVAGHGRAFGRSDKAVFVRNPLMILGTLPRVLGPEEEVDLPVAVFALEDRVKDVSIEAKSEGPVTVRGSGKKKVTFTGPGEDLVTFRLNALPQTGVAAVTLDASGGGEKAGQKIEFDIRMPTHEVTEVLSRTVAPGEAWNQEVVFKGMEGTNRAMLEISRIPPIDLGRRLRFLIRYPHGCVEQVTSSVFPQLYLAKFVELSPERQDEIQANIIAGIDRLRMFQSVNGGFSYWPGNAEAHDWASNYAGHFLVEAQKAGYLIPPGVLDQWEKYQMGKARAWTSGEYRSELIQAYRLYTLALAGAAELGAMNRLKEMPGLPDDARWRLAAAFHLAGQPEAARRLVAGLTTDVPDYRELSNTFGSSLRDKAMVLETLGIMGMMDKGFPLAQDISKILSNDRWLSTQATAYALIAMAQISAAQAGEMQFAYAWREETEKFIASGLPIVQTPLSTQSLSGGTLKVVNNGNINFYARLIRQGVPRPGMEKGYQNDLALEVLYYTLDNKALDPANLEQGMDFIAEVKVSNVGVRGEYKEVALSHLVPSGWEIRNLRMAPTGLIDNSDFDYQDIRDDRVYTYFNLSQGKSKKFYLLLNASYLGKYYLPSIHAGAMYDDTIGALVPGRWITVKTPGRAR
ncbi:MAG: hypothetical protein JXR49_01010 [Acidobacteria bacterium]|nr:hypothetical protein [Acidobacteriota bacterium]